MKHGVEVYTSSSVIDVRELESPYLNMVHELEQFKIGSFTILPFSVDHDVPNLGFLIYSNVTDEKLLFLTDLYTCGYKFNDLDYIMIETNYCKEILDRNIDNGLLPSMLRERILHSHFSLNNAKLFLSKLDLSRVKEIMLIHLSDGNSDSKMFLNEIKSLTGIPTRIL